MEIQGTQRVHQSQKKKKKKQSWSIIIKTVWPLDKNRQIDQWDRLETSE